MQEIFWGAPLDFQWGLGSFLKKKITLDEDEKKNLGEKKKFTLVSKGIIF